MPQRSWRSRRRAYTIRPYDDAQVRGEWHRLYGLTIKCDFCRSTHLLVVAQFTLVI